MSPRRIPIAIAKRVAEEQGCQQVIIAAWDGARTHVVTYGKTVVDCDQAALGGDAIKAALGWPKDLNAEPSRVTKLRQLLAEAAGHIVNSGCTCAGDMSEGHDADCVGCSIAAKFYKAAGQ